MRRRLALLATLMSAACEADTERRPAGPAEGAAGPAVGTPAAPAVTGGASPALPVTEPSAGAWGDLAKPEDIRRYERLDAAWREALAEARVEHAAELATLGPLANPKAGLPRPHPAPGRYRCRVVKLGSPGGTLAFVSYPGFRCRVDLTPGGDLTLAKQTGSQRTTGQLYPERDAGGADTDRLVYLGSQAWGSDEPSAPGYGRDPERDQIGVLERIGPDRYRLALPWPRQESKLDLLELERVGN